MHALLQVVALWLRSGAKADEPALGVDEEMDYAVTLNRALPDDIRVLGWTPVPEGFSARCSSVLTFTPFSGAVHVPTLRFWLFEVHALQNILAC